MSFIAYTLIAIGGLGSIVGSIWFLVQAFRQGVWWGIGSICLPFVSLICLVKFWHEMWRSWAVSAVGYLIMWGGILLLGSTMPATGGLAGLDDFGDDSYSEDYYDEDGDEYDAYDTYEDDTSADDVESADDDPANDPAADGSLADDATVGNDGIGQGALLPEAPLGAAPPRRTPSRIASSIPRQTDDSAIPLEFASDYIGKRMKITKTSGTVVYCRLVEVRDETLVIRQSLGGGNVRFTLPFSSIAKLARDER